MTTTTGPSGARTSVGYDIEMSGQEGICRLTIADQHLNLRGILHGGYVSMLLDNAGGAAVRAALSRANVRMVTVNLSVNFLASCSAGQVIAKGSVSGGGRSLKFTSTELHHEDGKLLATASACYRILE